MTTGKIAIPYYGDLVRPATGFERIFFIVDHDEKKPFQPQAISLGIWDANQTQLLPSWLVELGVNQVVCSSNPDSTLLDTMLNAGIRVVTESSEAARRILKQLNII
jgi:hypothetical protein